MRPLQAREKSKDHLPAGNIPLNAAQEAADLCGSKGMFLDAGQHTVHNEFLILQCKAAF